MKWWIAVVVVGVILLASSTGIGRDDGVHPEDITCGGDVMRPGDVCEETRRGVTVDTYTYEQRLQEQKDAPAKFATSGRWIRLGIGSALLVGGVVGIFLTRRRRAQQKAKYGAMYAIPQDGGQPAQPAQAPHMPPPVQQHQPQQQYQPQQHAPQQYPPQQHAPQQYPQQHPQQPYPPQQQPPHPQSYPDFGPRPGQ